MVILTTLRAEGGFTRDEIVKSYGARWGIETIFRELKSFAGLEPLHAKSALGVEHRGRRRFDLDDHRIAVGGHGAERSS